MDVINIAWKMQCAKQLPNYLLSTTIDTSSKL